MKLYYYACSRPSSMAAAQALLYRPAQLGLAGPNQASFLRSATRWRWLAAHLLAQPRLAAWPS